MKFSVFLTKKSLQDNFPIKTLYAILGGWILLAVLNFLSLKYWMFTGCDLLFPFSVLYPSNFLWTGFLAGFVFLFLGFCAFKNSSKFPVPVILSFCFLLVLLGNLAQGNLDIAFEQPFYLKGLQYYSDAIKLTDPLEFLRTFTEKQDEYLMHTRTHPPFVVLLHYLILKVFNGNILALGTIFFLISSLFFPILNSILKNIDFDYERRKQVLLFSAVVPSINIYSLVSIDGIILMTSSLLLLGISRMLRQGKVDVWAVILCALSIFLTNLLSFSGLFLLAFFGLFSAFYFLKKRIDFTMVCIVSIIVNVILFCGIYWYFGYNHWLTFHKASSSENPGGFMLFEKPYIYFWTRAQAVAEILMFLSLGFVAVLFGRKYYKQQLFSDLRINLLFASAISSLGLMFLSGAYGTGETARSCLFIVPFFILLLKNVRSETFFVIYFLSLLQAFGMQLIGNFFW